MKKNHANYLLDQLNKRKQFLQKIIKNNNNSTLDKQMAVSELDKIAEIEIELERLSIEEIKCPDCSGLNTKRYCQDNVYFCNDCNVAFWFENKK